MALKWSPSEVNIATSATTGATHASTGFIFTFPAIFLLASQAQYELASGPLITLGEGEALRLAFIGIVALRFTSALFIRWLDLYPRLETAGFLAVAFVALRLIVHVVLPSLNQPDWFTLLVVLILFAWGMSVRINDFDQDESHAC